MNTQVKELLDRANQLSVDDRIYLADMLYAEITPPVEEWEAAWAEECERRLAEYDRGEVYAEDFDLVMARLKEKFLPK